MAETKPKRGAPKGVTRPHTWKSGADEFRHSMYTPWQKARAQANFRDEEWELTFDEFYDLWKDHWLNRGRKPDDYCMTRTDASKPWKHDNIIVLTRHDQLIRTRSSRKPKVGRKRKNSCFV